MTRPRIRALYGVGREGAAPLIPLLAADPLSPHVRKGLVLGVCRAEVAVLPEPAE